MRALFFFPVLYTETIPVDIPPSYRGHAVKYSYKITIGVGRLQAPTKLLRLNFRVLSVQGSPKIFFFSILDTKIITIINKVIY